MFINLLCCLLFSLIVMPLFFPLYSTMAKCFDDPSTRVDVYFAMSIIINTLLQIIVTIIIIRIGLSSQPPLAIATKYWMMAIVLILISTAVIVFMYLVIKKQTCAVPGEVIMLKASWMVMVINIILFALYCTYVKSENSPPLLAVIVEKLAQRKAKKQKEFMMKVDELIAYVYKKDEEYKGGNGGSALFTDAKRMKDLQMFLLRNKLDIAKELLRKEMKTEQDFRNATTMDDIKSTLADKPNARVQALFDIYYADKNDSHPSLQSMMAGLNILNKFKK